MEIKIKENGNLINATIEVVNGVMVVSPKEEKYEPKDGDVVYSGGFSDFVFIYKDNLTAEAYFYAALSVKDGKIILPDGGHIGYVSQLRPATEEEKQKLFDKLKEEGYEFDFQKKELVKLKWKPKLCDLYYNPCYAPNIGFKCKELQWNNDTYDNSCYNFGWVFRTKEECQSFCDKLNQAINRIKP